MEAKIPPHNDDSEMAVLSCLLRDEGCLPSALQNLKPEDFYRTKHKIIYKAIGHLFQNGSSCDVMDVNNALKKSKELSSCGGFDYLCKLESHVPTTSVLDYHIVEVKNKRHRRDIITVAAEIINSAQDEAQDDKDVKEKAEKYLFELARVVEDKDSIHISKVLPKVFEFIEKAMNSSSPVTGLSTGFDYLDKLTGGFHENDLIILAARPGMGKTALALNIATNVAGEGTPVQFFSMEMSREQLVQRILCSVSQVDSRRVTSGVMGSNDWPLLTEGGVKVGGLPIWIDDAGVLNSLEMRSRARQKKAEHGVGLIVVDYIQLMNANKHRESRQQEITEISRNLKALASDLKVPVLALSQLNRSCESRTDKRPLLSDLRESGSIEQDADTIMFLYRDDYYNEHSSRPGVCEVDIKKQRNGPTGKFTLRWEPEIVRFSDTII